MAKTEKQKEARSKKQVQQTLLRQNSKFKKKVLQMER